MPTLPSIIFNGFNVAGIIIGFGLAIYVWNRNYSFQGNWIRLWLLVVSIHQVYFFTSLNGFIGKDNLLHGIGFPLAMLHLPLFYMNVKELVDRTTANANYVLHLLPYVFYSGVLIWLLHIYPDLVFVDNGFLHVDNELSKVLRHTNGVPIALSGITYTVLCGMLVRRYQQQVSQYYSNTDGVSLGWIRQLVALIGVLFVVIFVLIVAQANFHFFDSSYAFRYVSVILTGFTTYYGFNYVKQIELFYKRNMSVPPAEKYSDSSLHQEELKRIEAMIISVLEYDKLFLDEDLTLAKLAGKIGQSTQKVSETMNRQMGSSFYTIVNRYRVDEAKTRLRSAEYHNLSIDGIGYDCGFRSRSTFFKLFKQETGMTPKEFKGEADEKSLHPLKK